MEKNAEYIRMCTAAEEIQCRWQPVYGDFYVDAEGQIRCWISRTPGPVRIKRGFGICVRDGVIHLLKFIWLPRQNQLIEMAQIPGCRYESVVQDFFDWTRQRYAHDGKTPGKLFRSMEKIWLAFVMNQKYAKQWDGKSWIRKPYPARRG
ncbi:MAG: hypothetical protein U5R30_07720 [Deltaproteobacteria bacterium]|nr:hypothetical protein [Deltaproteobacteria bacterium]